ncbi:Uncharacterised protein [uncultured archaeon]|nr:Uncharacterised protein [uncultured archaeon]
MGNLVLVYNEKSQDHPIIPGSVVFYSAYNEYNSEKYVSSVISNMLVSNKVPRAILSSLEKRIFEELGLKSDMTDILNGKSWDNEEIWKNLPRCLGYTCVSEKEKEEIKRIHQDFVNFSQ